MVTHAQIWNGIDRLAAAHGYSASGLAKKAGLDPTSFNKSKRQSPDGKPRWPSTESIVKILAVTGASMSDYIELIESPAEEKDNRGKPMDTPAQAAKILFDTESVLFNPDEPFVFTSGRLSPVYIDCRRLISFPEARGALMESGAKLLAEEVGLENIDYVAGGETAGIPYAAFIAERLGKPMLYVRKQPKGFGRMAQIEGHIEGKNPKVILVEDLQTDGGSKKVFIDALREAGCVVEHSFVVFHYGIYNKSKENMDALGVTLHALTTWWDVLDYARENKLFDPAKLYEVEAFLNDPEGWQERNKKEA